MIGSFGTPIVWKNEGVEEAVLAGALQIKGYDLQTGEERWSVNGIAVLHSGFALGETMGTSQSGTVFGNRPNFVPGCKPAANPTPTQWFNTSCFSAPAIGVLGNARRSNFYGPGQANLDLSLYKTVPVTERLNFQFRSEFFNILNHTQLGTPATAFGNANFGTITTLVNAPRQIQFALKLLF